MGRRRPRPHSKIRIDPRLKGMAPEIREQKQALADTYGIPLIQLLDIEEKKAEILKNRSEEERRVEVEKDAKRLALGNKLQSGTAISRKLYDEREREMNGKCTNLDWEWIQALLAQFKKEHGGKDDLHCLVEILKTCQDHLDLKPSWTAKISHRHGAIYIKRRFFENISKELGNEVTHIRMTDQNSSSHPGLLTFVVCEPSSDWKVRRSPDGPRDISGGGNTVTLKHSWVKDVNKEDHLYPLDWNSEDQQIEIDMSRPVPA